VLAYHAWGPAHPPQEDAIIACVRLPIPLLVAAAALLAAPPASAAPGDRDRDGMADRWERRHHVSKARGDRDRDGLSNRSEFRHRTNPRRADTDADGLSDLDDIRFGWHPRRADTDGDGLRDAAEGAGIVDSFTNRTLVIRLASGGRSTAAVTDDTRFDCPPTAYDDHEPDDEATPEGPEDPGTGSQGDPFGLGPDPEEDAPAGAFEDRCEGQLVAGAPIHASTLAGSAFAVVELVERG
jgi:hypothetical protein